MKKSGRGRILGVLTALVLLVAILHTSLHFVAFGTGFDKFYGSGVSGLVIKNIDIGTAIRTKYPSFSPISKIALIAEWALFVALMILGIFISGKKMTSYSIPEKTDKPSDKSKIKTDLDVLYTLLQEKKRIPISAISKTFNVDKETASEWCKILESGNLATVNYPKFGEPEIKLEE